MAHTVTEYATIRKTRWRAYGKRNGFTLMVGVGQVCPKCAAAREAFASHGPRGFSTVTHVAFSCPNCGKSDYEFRGQELDAL